VKEFFYMGGYAFYVWTSYGIVALVMTVEVIHNILQQRREINNIKRQQAHLKAAARKGEQPHESKT